MKQVRTVKINQVDVGGKFVFLVINKTFLLDPEIMETFDRANYRQSGSSLDSNNDFKKKKNGKIFKFGMFK